jgi:hypothetical protein
MRIRSCETASHVSEQASPVRPCGWGLVQAAPENSHAPELLQRGYQEDNAHVGVPVATEWLTCVPAAAADVEQSGSGGAAAQPRYASFLQRSLQRDAGSTGAAAVHAAVHAAARSLLTSLASDLASAQRKRADGPALRDTLRDADGAPCCAAAAVGCRTGAAVADAIAGGEAPAADVATGLTSATCAAQGPPDRHLADSLAVASPGTPVGDAVQARVQNAPTQQLWAASHLRAAPGCAPFLPPEQLLRSAVRGAEGDAQPPPGVAAVQGAVRYLHQARASVPNAVRAMCQLAREAHRAQSTKDEDSAVRACASELEAGAP